MVTDTVLGVTHTGSVATIALARGKVNALDVQLLDELATTLERLEHDDDVRAVVVTGSGRVFSAGVDLRRVVEADSGYVERLIAGLRVVFEALFGFRKPTVAAVQGYCVGGGTYFALLNDMRRPTGGAADHE